MLRQSSRECFFTKLRDCFPIYLIKKKGNIKPAFIIQGKSNPEYLEAHEKAIPQNVSGCNEILGFIEIPHKSVFTYTQQRLNEQK